MPVHYQRTHARSGQLLPYAVLCLTWAFVHTSFFVFRDLHGFDLGLVGPDSFMRMLRVTELYEGWDWFNGTIARANAPYGDTLHWTRPFDVLLLLIALPASLFVGYEQALFMAGMFVSPLLQLATALLLVWALRPLIRPELWFLPAIAVFLQPGALAQSVLGRADHHSLLLLVFVIAAGFTLRALRTPEDARPALYAGATVGFGIWLSVEFLLVMGLCLVSLGLPWLFGEAERARQSKWFALAMSCVLLIALFAERPLEHLLAPSYDRVSCVQFLVAVCVMLFWRMLETYEGRQSQGSRFFGRMTLTLLGVGALGLLVNAIFPLFFAGPLAAMDPRIASIWLDRVLEMQPIVPSDRYNLGRFVFYFGCGILMTPFFLKILMEERHSERFWAFMFVAAAGLVMWVIATRHVRFSGYAEVAFVMAFAVVLERFLRWSSGIGSDLLRGLLRGGFITIALLGPVLIGSALEAAHAEAESAAHPASPGCKVHQVADYLQTDPRWAQAPQTVLAFIDMGPELLYRTRHRVIGTPYHRNGEGIFDDHRILTTRDDDTAHQLMSQRQVDLVLLCLSPAERRFYADEDGKENLYQKLEQGVPPSWLEAVELPPALRSQAKLYQVVR